MRRFLISGGVLVALSAAALWYFSTPDILRATLEAKYAQPPSQFVMLADGARAHIRDRGTRDGKPLVLIHGSNASLFTWEPWAKRLEDTFRVITVDLPGHGLTGAVPNRDYSEDGMVKFVGEVADALALQRFAVGGNSMGGRVAARFAEVDPARVTHLILVDASGLPSKQDDRTPLAFWLLRTPVINRMLLRVAPRSIVALGLNEAFMHKDIISDAMIDSYWELGRMEGTREATLSRANTPGAGGVQAHIADIKAPTLILWGEEDRLVPVDVAHAFQAGIPGSRLIIYPKTGHGPQEEVAEQSAAEVRAFLGNP